MAKLGNVRGIKKENPEPQNSGQIQKTAFGKDEPEMRVVEISQRKEWVLGNSLEPFIHLHLHSFNKHLLNTRQSSRCWGNVMNWSAQVPALLKFISQQTEQTYKQAINEIISESEENGACLVAPSQSRKEMLHREAARGHLRGLHITLLFSVLCDWKNHILTDAFFSLECEAHNSKSPTLTPLEGRPSNSYTIYPRFSKYQYAMSPGLSLWQAPPTTAMLSQTQADSRRTLSTRAGTHGLVFSLYIGWDCEGLRCKLSLLTDTTRRGSYWRHKKVTHV